MESDVLIIATAAGTEECAGLIARQLGVQVEVAQNRRAALVMLQQNKFKVVVAEESLIEGDSAWADRVWQTSGSAMPVILNFAISGCPRLLREVRSALSRQAAERANARREAAEAIVNEIKTPLTGLLLESELALRDPSVPAALEPKLRHVLELAGAIRERLRSGDINASLGRSKPWQHAEHVA